MIGVPCFEPICSDRVELRQLRVENAAISSLGRYEEPISRNVYLFTWPLKKRLRLVPFLRMISPRSANDGSLTTSAPSPDTRFLLSWKETAARCPSAPAGRPSQLDPSAYAASSTTIKSCAGAIAPIVFMSQGAPA